ncbi:MAG: hypothetical protein NTZ68_00875 [Candidatus Dependentiae bacterium]|nr:hypothetical protein [Candidatus Dependentiae bacterium]
MEAKKIISLSIFLAISSSLTECSLVKTSGITIEHNSKSTTPAPAAASSTTPPSLAPAAIVPVSIFGQAYPTEQIDPATQIEPFNVGKTALDGHHKGLRESSLAYVKRLAKDKRLKAALTDPARTEQKTRERFSEALIEGDATLAKLTTAQTGELKTFLDQQRAACAALSTARKSTTVAFLTRQKSVLQQTTSDVDVILQIVHSMPDAKGSLSDACIREELIKLEKIQRQKEADLKTQKSADAELLQQMIDTMKEASAQHVAESQAAIIKIRQLRELLHSSHPAPLGLAQLSPRPAAPTALEVKSKK